MQRQGLLKEYYFGVDLGQANDYTALSVVERNQPVIQKGDILKNTGEHFYNLRYLERLPLRTPYPDQVQKVKALYEDERLAKEQKFLIVDNTGVGRPVSDLFKKAGINPISINITGGHETHRVTGGYNVPKRDLATNLQVFFQNGRLKVARGIKEVDTLINELMNFKIKVNPDTGHDRYEHREGEHDDLVLSVALAVWYSEKKLSGGITFLK